MANVNLQAARAAKKDEFYTQLSDIEKELRHYKEHFRGKTVLCNCDDPRVSNFFVYFQRNFEHLGLKRLITTCYKHQDVDLFGDHSEGKAVYLIYDGDKNHNNVLDPEELDIKPLQGDGDFRSEECVELLKQADIVVTNPPFSLFREYVAQLMKYEKKFLIIGNVNAITYKEFFPLLKDNKVWIGPSIHSGDREFGVPEEYSLDAAGYRIDGDGNKFIRVKGVRWFTNLDYKERHEPMVLYRKYNPSDYPKYELYDIIDVSKSSEVPEDYYGIMGVPITFMDIYCPDQFDILGISMTFATQRPSDLPKSKQGGPAFYLKQDGEYKRMYGRILIRRKQ